VTTYPATHVSVPCSQAGCRISIIGDWDDLVEQGVITFPRGLRLQYGYVATCPAHRKDQQ
jgi:hypothetical protein